MRPWNPTDPTERLGSTLLHGNCGQVLYAGQGGAGRGGPAQNPTSWNMYAYMQGDPVNGNDVTATEPCQFFNPGDPTQPPCDGELPLPDCLRIGPGLLALNPFCGIVLPARRPPPPPKLDWLDTIPQSWVTFVENNFVAGNSLQTLSSVKGYDILGWAALESGWGTNTAARVNNNYFSWGGSGDVKCPDGADPPWGCFSTSDIFLSGLTALLSTRNYFSYGGQIRVASATILNDQFSQGASITQAFDALAHAGYTPDPGYGAGVATRVGQVLGTETCLSSHGLLGKQFQ